jgi:hypothetical protein
MYTIISPRLGTPGTKFEPTEGVNVSALLDGGFIKSDKADQKPAKTTTKTSKG